jgi:hypothetical protein
MSSATQIPDPRPASASEVQENAISTLLGLQGIAASPAELRSASRAWQRLNPQGPAKPPARASS